MLTLVIILKALAEIIGLALLGQGVLYFLAGPNRENNIFYKILKAITAPVIKATRFIAPRFIPDRNIGFLTLFLIMAIWVILTIVKIKLILEALNGPPMS